MIIIAALLFLLSSTEAVRYTDSVQYNWLIYDSLKPDSSYTYAYGSKKNSRKTENEYLTNGRTLYRLYDYYLPEGLTSDDVAPFYSSEYTTTYYDGYGFDFYYGGYGFYEYSVLPIKPALNIDDQNITLFIVVSVIAALFCLCSIVIAK